MESTALSLAHVHAKNASDETHKANPVAASEEHDLAAGEFANAAKTTSDTEALRTLRLLEQHHQKLAELLKFKPEELHHILAAPSPEASKGSSLSIETVQTPSHNTAKAVESPARHISNIPPSLIQSHHRDSSSSIASNLASARGIHSNRPKRANQSPAALSIQLGEGRVSNPARRSRLGEPELTISSIPEEEQSKNIPSALLPSRARVSDPDINPTSPSRSTAQLPVQEDNFSRFYATFEGLLSKLSAPLAFAGLPLLPNETSKPSEKPRSTDRATVDPDVTRIFSKAALRVIREDGFAGAAESFYVVPTTGGTMSYAGMLSRGESDGLDDEFVDAREMPQRSGSPDLKRRGQKSTKTVEELQMENDALKHVAVDLGDRLRVFELNAQKSSMALHMSMRAFASPTASAAVHGKAASPDGGSHLDLEKKVEDLEEEITVLQKDAKRVGRENAKLMAVVERYRERWEKLKDGARERVRGEGDTRA